MWVSSATGGPWSGSTPIADVYNGSNQIPGNTYDQAGNQLTVNGNTLSYDGENRLLLATAPPSLGGGTETYFYDGAGQRVAKSGPGNATIYVYDALGQLASEYDG